MYTGIHEFDSEMRGVSGGQLLVLIGHSANGKSLVANHIIRHNRDKRMLYFIPDEDAPLVLAKLTSSLTGIDGRSLEERIARHDEEAKRLLVKVATEEFPNLCVIDGSVDAHVMTTAWDECTDAWGAEPELVIFDFLDLLQVSDSIIPKFDFVKAYGRDRNVPFMLLHQTSRSGGADGKKLTMTSGGYGGESHATYMIGVRRRKYGLMAERAELQAKIERGQDTKGEAAQRLVRVESELEIHEYTVTANLLKNKRVGGSQVDDIDFELEIGTGLLSPLRGLDLPEQYRSKRPSVRFGPDDDHDYYQEVMS